MRARFVKRDRGNGGMSRDAGQHHGGIRCSLPHPIPKEVLGTPGWLSDLVPSAQQRHREQARGDAAQCHPCSPSAGPEATARGLRVSGAGEAGLKAAIPQEMQRARLTKALGVKGLRRT